MHENYSISAWLIEAMKKTPLWEDNVKNDQSAVNKLIMAAKVSLLLLWNLLTGKIASYLKSSGKPHTTLFGSPQTESAAKAKRMIFNLPHPLDVVDEKSGIRLNIPAVEYYIPPTPDSPDDYNQQGPIRLHFRTQPMLVYPNGGKMGYFYDHNMVCAMIAACRDKLLREVSLYELLNPVTPYKSIQQTCHFFGVSPDPYKPYNQAVGMISESFTPTYDDDEYWENLKKKNPHISETIMIERQLRAILDHDPDVVFREVLSGVSEGFHRQVFTFNNEHGYPVMKVVKRLNYGIGCIFKEYIPFIQMRHNGKSQSRYETLPRPDVQILYNLDKIRRADIVVICPDLEIAGYFQSVNSRVDIAFTAYLSDDLEQVDFSPLKDKEVWLLVVNHSGLSLAEAYINSENLYNYLTDNGKQKELNAVQAEIKYAAIPNNIKTTSEYMNFRRSHAKAEIVPGSIIEMTTEEEYAVSLENAKREAARKVAASQDQQFWAPENVEEEVVEEEKTAPPKRELIRTIAARGCITYFAGATHIGKSNFIAALCAYAVNISQRKPNFLSERCWTVCKTGSKYKRLKIVQLDFENGQAGIDQREIDFVDPYMPDDPEERKACKANYIVKDLLSDPINYSDESHFEDLCKMINDCAANEGEKGQPVDILVIDTYWSFVHENDTKFDVLKKLIAAYPDMAIIVLHHLNADGKSYGRQDKDFGAAVVLYMERPNCTEIKDLLEPFQIRVGKKNRLTHLGVDLEPFFAKLDEKGHFLVDNSKYKKAEIIKALKEGYKTKGKDGKARNISDRELADRLGMGVEKLNKFLTEAQKEGEKK